MSLTIQWPVRRDAWISQQFGENPDIYKKFNLPGHEGIDWAIPIGTEIYAVADGVVSDIQYVGQTTSAYGTHIRIQHQGGAYQTLYAHLSQVIVAKEQSVQAGQVIALSGNTGNSTGPHLHFTLKKRGASYGETAYRDDIVNPSPYLAATDAPRPTPPAQTTLDVQVNAGDGLNLRDAPAVGAVLTVLPCGTIVGALEAEDVTRRKLGQDNQWLWVRTSAGQVGHVAALYVNLPGAAAGGAQSGVAGGEMYRVQVNIPGDTLNFRPAPSTDPVLDQLPHGMLLDSLETPDATLSKVGEYGEWLHVRTPAGKEGYVAAWCLCLPSESGAAGPGALSFGLDAEAPGELRPLGFDDLERIKGIGPKIAALLVSVGIGTFRQLAALTPTQLKAVLAETGLRGSHVETWSEQARAISEV